MNVPHGMSLNSQIAVVVGYVHCNLNSSQIALALGYRSGSSYLYYTLQQVRDVFGYLARVASDPPGYNVYFLWGPLWDKHEGPYRISEAKMMFHKRLIMEALRRGEVVTENRRRAADALLRGQGLTDTLWRQNIEYETRIRIWRAINADRLQRPGGQWDAFDDRNLLWNGLAERRAVVDGPG